MDTLFAIAGIAVTLAIGAALPGASFAMVAHTALSVSRRDGLAAALGMGVGGLVFGVLASLGLTAVFAADAWITTAFKVCGGFYLIYFAVALWRGASRPVVFAEDDRPEAVDVRRSFALALMTQLSNPKAVLIYVGIFAAFMPATMPLWGFAVLLPVILAVEFGWYAVVAVVFSTPRPRAAYLGAKGWIDRTAGAIIGALGVKLAFDAARP